MKIGVEKIKDKQRIVFIGNTGTNEIIEITSFVLDQINKPYDFIKESGECRVSDESPLILIQRGNKIADEHKLPNYLNLSNHISVIHHIDREDLLAEENLNLEIYYKQYEILLDKTPKSGVLIYNKEDILATLVSALKDRDDISLIEYESLPLVVTQKGFIVENVEIITKSKDFPSYLAASKELLKRLGVESEEFFNIVKNIKLRY